MYFFGNKIGWRLVYEDGAYCLYEYCVWMNLFVNILDYWQRSILMIYNGMEQLDGGSAEGTKKPVHPL
jgi:hypothetical protein